MSFLLALYRCMPYQQHSTRGVCRLFNPKNKSDERGALRDEWAQLGEGRVELENVERVLRSLVGAVLPVRAASYTLTLVPRYGVGSRDVWRFGPARDSIEQFIRLLRIRMPTAGKGVRLEELWRMVNADEELGLIAASLLYRDPPLTRLQVSSLLTRGCEYRRVDGLVLVRRPDRRWIFVQRGAKSV